MSDWMISVIAKLRAKPSMEEEVKKELMGLVAPSRTDKGCINYDLHQSVDDPCLFVFYENWESKSDLDAHLGLPHVQAALGKVGPLLAEPPELTLLKKLSDRA
jgi:quinol monooxygenase YgiN